MDKSIQEKNGKAFTDLYILLQKEKDSLQRKEDKVTFLSTIGKEYHETYLSKIVLYVLIKQKDLPKKLINNYIEKKQTDWKIEGELEKEQEIYQTEKVMGGGRADIFIKLKDAANDPITITIENKCFSEEHDTSEDISQTKTYAQYVKKHEGKRNVFYYLKPCFNYSEPDDDAFMTITYDELNKMIDGNSDYIIADFKKHIGEYLTKMKISDAERLYFQNYAEINDFLYGAQKKLRDIMYVDAEILGLKKGEIQSEPSNGSAYRIFKPYWLNKDWDDMWSSIKDCKDIDKKAELYSELYFFYIEIQFGNMVCRNMVRNYDNSEKNIVNNYLEYKDDSFSQSETVYVSQLKTDHVLQSESFLQQGIDSNDEWIESLQKWTKMTIQKLFRKMDEIVEDFENWRSRTCRN